MTVLLSEYSKINPNEIPCNEGRKKYFPYKCEFVPKDYLQTVIDRYPKLCEFVFWECHKNWMIDYVANRRYSQRQQSSKKWWLHPLSVKLQGIIQRELNYEKSTFKTGHIYHRFGKVYRQMNGYHWDYRDAFGPERSLVFYKNGVELISIKDR